MMCDRKGREKFSVYELSNIYCTATTDKRVFIIPHLTTHDCRDIF